MIDLSPLVQRLKGSPLENWADDLQQQLDQLLKQSKLVHLYRKVENPFFTPHYVYSVNITLTNSEKNNGYVEVLLKK